MAIYGHDWYVGMKVAFISLPNPRTTKDFTKLPEIGQVTTITRIELVEPGQVIMFADGGIFVCSAPGPVIYIDVSWDNGATLWAAKAWRPVNERPTDISIFTAMLTDVKHRQPEKA